LQNGSGGGTLSGFERLSGVTRVCLGVVAIAFALALAGCGGDERESRRVAASGT
jgi:hypothetical protein